MTSYRLVLIILGRYREHDARFEFHASDSTKGCGALVMFQVGDVECRGLSAKGSNLMIGCETWLLLDADHLNCTWLAYRILHRTAPRSSHLAESRIKPAS